MPHAFTTTLAPATRAPRFLARVFSNVRHAGLPAALYAAGIVLMSVLLLDPSTAGPSPDAPRGALGAALLVWGIYALDRVKIANTWIERDDGPPGRQRLVQHHPGALRLAAAILITAGTLTLASVAWHLALLTPPAIALVVAYAFGPRTHPATTTPPPTSRPTTTSPNEPPSKPPSKPDTTPDTTPAKSGLKQIRGYKYAAIPIAFTFLAVAIADAIGARTPGAPIALPVLILLARVAIDTALCDLDDESTDRARGTPTIATALGHNGAIAALLLAEAAFATTLLVHRLIETDRLDPIATAFGVAIPVSTAGLLMLRLQRITDLVDARLGLVALAAAYAPFT